MIKVIQFFKPEYWYIENPKRSLIWDYIIENYHFKEKTFLNSTYFVNYGASYLGHTTFMSNIKLNLSDIKIINPTIKMGYVSGSNGDRSEIPEDLIISIFNKFKL